MYHILPPRDLVGQYSLTEKPSCAMYHNRRKREFVWQCIILSHKETLLDNVRYSSTTRHHSTIYHNLSQRDPVGQCIIISHKDLVAECIIFSHKETLLGNASYSPTENLLGKVLYSPTDRPCWSMYHMLPQRDLIERHYWTMYHTLIQRVLVDQCTILSHKEKLLGNVSCSPTKGLCCAMYHILP